MLPFQEQEFLFFIVIAFILLYLLGRILRDEEILPNPLQLQRNTTNPILSPRTEYSWEAEAVFNPSAVYDGERVHLFYRAIGNDGVSRIGYATSTDGIHFNERLPYPVFELQREALPQHDPKNIPHIYHPGLYASGGSWGGAEDPRVVKIDDDIHMTLTAFLGWDAVRVALTSILHSDLTEMKWCWRKLGFLSPPGQVHKNWVLFPEKINGKYAVLHSISPHINVHYADSLDELYNEDSFIESSFEKMEREKSWDTWLRGAGPPPLKTKDGWLLLYHAIEKEEPDRYKVGALLLSHDNPSHIKHRSPTPLLSPLVHYENEGKPGVVYATGAIIIGDTLFVYYGGGDKTVNVATAPLSEFLEELKLHKEPTLYSV